MRWATFRDPEGQVRTGIVIDNNTVRALPPGVELISLLPELVLAAREAQDSGDIFPLADVKLLPPIPRPPNIRDFSSFMEHHKAGIQAVGQKWDDAWFEFPFFYFSNTNTLLADGDLFLKPHNSKKMDYEMEICCVVARECMDVAVEDAESHIAGYMIFNDWSARDLQTDEMARAPVGPAKSKDSGNSFGPYLVTPDELEDRRSGAAFDLEMKAYVNGRLYSEGNWSSVHWSMAEQLSYASRNTRLLPGDILATGTVGTGCILEQSRKHGSDAYPWLVDGDEVVLEVERLGRLRNIVRDGAPPHPIRGRINGSRV